MSVKKSYSPTYKAKVALEAISANKTFSELSSEFGVHASVIAKWVRQLKESAAGIFSGDIKTEEAKKEKELHDLHAKIGQLIVERDFLARAWEKR